MKPVINLADAARSSLDLPMADTFSGMGKEGILKGKPYLFSLSNFFKKIDI